MERAESALVIFVLKFVTVGSFYRESSQGDRMEERKRTRYKDCQVEMKQKGWIN